MPFAFSDLDDRAVGSEFLSARQAVLLPMTDAGKGMRGMGLWVLGQCGRDHMKEEDRTDGARPGDAARLYEESLILLSSVRGTLAALLGRVSAGDATALKELTAKQAELEFALKRAFETEQRFNDWKAKHDRSSWSDEIDFDIVRHDIGCRLARLRSCCEAD